MLGRKKINYKIGLAILAFSIIITLAFSVLLLLFQHSAKKEPASASSNSIAVYPLSNEDLLSVASGDKSLPVFQERLVNINEYQIEYAGLFISQLLPYAALFCVILVAASFFLWLLLKKMYLRHTGRLAESLSDIDGCNSFTGANHILGDALDNIRNVYNANLINNKRLYAYLSHEQKNAISILRADIEHNGDTRYLDNVDDIAGSIDSILTLSESDVETEKSMVDVALVCAAVCDKYSNITNSISFEFDEDGTEIMAKPRWIYRAVSCLVDNALKYGEGKPIEVSVKNKYNSVIVKVEDNGVGIPVDKQEEVFNHNYRINDLNQDGYGIGLSVVSHVCDLCGGFAMVESKPGCGSTFYLAFPSLEGR